MGIRKFWQQLFPARKLTPDESALSSDIEAGRCPEEFQCVASYCPNTHIVRVVCTGWLTKQANTEIVETALAACQEHSCKRVMIDNRQVNLAMRFIDICDLPDLHAEMGVPYDIHVALLYTPSQATSHLYRFYEDTSVLNGFRHYSFTEEQAAIEWLQ